MILIRTLITFIVFTSCVSPPEKAPSSPDNLVKNQTILPDPFIPEVGEEQFSHLIIPSELIQVGVVVRPRAEVREGPALHFSVQDNILTKGERVIEFQRVDVWSRIIAVKSGQRGWVHHQTLGRDHHAPREIEIETILLPNVFTAVEDARVYDYPSQRAVKARIPRGRALRLLLQGRSRAIVWIAETNAVMWIDLEDIE